MNEDERQRARDRAADGIASREGVYCGPNAWPNYTFDSYLSGTHGTRGKYSNGCRCDDCKRAARDWSRLRRTLAQSGKVPDGLHGRLSTYTNWGCRCDRCSAANAASCRSRYVPARVRRED